MDVSQLASTVFWVGSTKASCNISDVLAEMTNNRAGADQLLLETANAIRLRSYPRGKEYLTHFLNGSGTDKTFAMSELLRDQGVRKIIMKHFSRPRTPANKVITVGQSAYEDKDWQYALGTYFIYYEDVGEFPDANGKMVRYVKVKGLDTYQWHPEDTRRFTNCIHQAAVRLQKPPPTGGPSAKPFKMVGTEAIIDTTTGREVSLPIIPRSPIRMMNRRMEQSVPMGRKP